MSIYFRPPDGSRARAVALAQLGSTLILPTWTSQVAWTFNGSGLTTAPVSATAGTLEATGFAAAATDNLSGAWLLPYSAGPIYNLASGGAQTTFALPGAPIFVGGAFSPTQAHFYALDVSGRVYVPSGTGAVLLANAFGNRPCWGLEASGTTLYTLLAAASGIGTYTLSASAAGTTGFIATTMTNPAALAAAAGRVGVGGWSNASLASGFSDLSLDPIINTNLIGVSQTANRIVQIVDALSTNNWAITQTLAGSGNPSRVAWLPSGLGAFVTDPVSGLATLFNYSAGTLAFAQSIAVTGAGDVGVLAGSTRALVAQPGLNQVTPLAFTSSWATGTPVGVIPHAQVILPLTASGAAVGYASGVAFLSVSGSVWNVAASASLPFAPNALTLDPSGTVYAVGTQSGSGFLSVLVNQAVSATVSWVGAGSGTTYSQGQIVVGDPVTNILRVFGNTGTAYVSAGSITAPAGLNTLAMGATALFAASSGSITNEYQFIAPFTLDYLRNGAMAVNVSGSWNSVSLGVSNQPAAVTFDASGNLWGATIQNGLFAVSATGGIISSGQVAQVSPQPQSTPIGLSRMLWFNGHLYAASSLEGALVQVL